MILSTVKKKLSEMKPHTKCFLKLEWLKESDQEYDSTYVLTLHTSLVRVGLEPVRLDIWGKQTSH